MDGHACRRRASGAGPSIAGAYRTHQATGRALRYAPAETHRRRRISCCPRKFTPQEDGGNMVNPEWRQVQLGQAITLQRGFDLPYRVRHSGNVPIVTSSGINGTHNQAQALGPGVVTGRYGTIGEVFFIEEDFWPLNTTLFVKNFKG